MRTTRLTMMGILLALPLGTAAASDGEDGKAQAADAQSQQTAASAVDPQDEIKCKRQKVTGSNARRVRICKTVREWKRDSDEARRASEETIERGNTWGRGSPGS